MSCSLDQRVKLITVSQTVKETASTQGHSLSVAENRKIASHSSACHSSGVSFIPLAVETLGGWSPTAFQTLKSIGWLQAQQLGLCPKDNCFHLFQRLPVNQWRSNANMWISHGAIYLFMVNGVI